MIFLVALCVQAQVTYQRQDSLTICRLLQSATPQTGVLTLARHFLGVPYVAHTLEVNVDASQPVERDERLVVNTRQLDCTTLVETVVALKLCAQQGKRTWNDYTSVLRQLRYRGGVLDGYASRLHYISEWAVDNISRGNIVEVSGDLPASKAEVKTINFMTTHRDLYPQLSDSATCAKLRNFEIGYRNHKFEYVRKNMVGVKDVKNALLEGDIVGLVTKIEGLDVSHMGIIVKDEKGDNYLLDASASAGKVQVEPLALPKYLEKVKTCTGLRVFRIVKQ